MVIHSRAVRMCLNGSNVSLTENDGEYVGTFQMPAQASTLVINSGSDAEEGDQN